MIEERSFLDWLRSPKPNPFHGKYFVFETELGRVAKYKRLGRSWKERDGTIVYTHTFRYVKLNDTHTELVEYYEQDLGVKWFEGASHVFDTSQEALTYLQQFHIDKLKAPEQFFKKLFN